MQGLFLGFIWIFLHFLAWNRLQVVIAGTAAVAYLGAIRSAPSMRIVSPLM
jgi:hypothetical protein